MSTIHFAKARYKASRKKPYLAEALFSRLSVEVPTLPVALQFQDHIHWNPQYFAETDPDIASYRVLHEMGHVLFDTWHRGLAHREVTETGAVIAADMDRFWQAGCIAVNDWLEGALTPNPNKLNLPPGKTHEWYYDHLPANMSMPLGSGGLCCPVKPETEACRILHEAIRAEVAPHVPGNEPGGEWLSFMAKFKVKFDWMKRVKRRGFAAAAASIIEVPTYTQRSHKQGRLRGRLAGKRVETFPWIAVLVDSSGSVGDHERSVFASVLKPLADVARFYVVVADAAVQSFGEVASFRQILPLIRGGGGTDFCDAFQHLADHPTNFAHVFVLTDGYAQVPFHKPVSCDVSWCIYGEGSQPALWGETIPIKEQR